MDDTLRQLADAAAGFAKPDAARVRKCRSHTDGFDRSMWRAIAEQGWLSILVPESAGGFGLGIAAATIVSERLGYAGYREPYAAAGTLAAICLAASDRHAARDRFLPGMLEGSLLATVAWQGEQGGLQGDGTDIIVANTGTTRALTGAARYVSVPAAELFIVAARGTEGLALYGVERDTAGLTIRNEPLADGTYQGLLTFETMRVSDAMRLAEGTVAANALQTAVDTTLLVVSAELVGIMERVIEITLDYLRTRKQFGKAIGSFQVLQHRAVDLWIQKELSRAALIAAVHAFPNASPGARSAAASGVKARASQAALFVCNQAIQLHGAIGFTDEYDLGLYVNRALVLSAWLGNAAMHRRRYATLQAEALA
jgi:alkylation response protein AidB-like acyl-CoA dehydrogenase